MASCIWFFFFFWGESRKGRKKYEKEKILPIGDILIVWVGYSATREKIVRWKNSKTKN